MFGSVKKLARNRSGAFAMQFALMAMPLCICTGLAIDGGRAFLARFELASALDAAALAVGSTTTEGADLNAVAQKYVDINFKTAHEQPIKLQLTVDDDKATLKGTVDIKTYFMPLVGQPTVTVSAESEVRVGGNNVEVAMALDITGSMNQTRIDGLKAASKVLIDEVVNAVQKPYFSKVAVIPWSQSVFVGTTNADASVPVDLRGTPTASTPVSAATWRSGSAGTLAITSAGWRTAFAGKTVTGVSWMYGTAQPISGITKSGSTIVVTTSANHGYVNGNFVRITNAGGGYTALNSGVYVVADKANKTFTLKTSAGDYVTPPTGTPTASTTGSSQRCYDIACNVGIIPSASLGVAVGSRVRITGVNGFTSVNSAADTSWSVAALVPSTSIFTINGFTGPSTTETFNTSSSSIVSECFLADCKFQITTGTTSHGMSTGNYAYVWGAGVATSGNVGSTLFNNVANTAWSVTKTSDTQITLPGSGYNYKDWTSAGSIARCLLSTCNVQVSSTNHKLATGDRVEIRSVGGLTGINNGVSSSSSPASPNAKQSWVTTKLTNDTFSLNDTTPALVSMSANYSGSATAQCLAYGCAKQWFMNDASTSVEQIFMATPCLAERYGANAATDVSPTTSPLGILYSSDGNCTATNYVTPLTPDRGRLNKSIDDLKTGGSTAGQIGIAWAWYMLSPNFDKVWDKEPENVPMPYPTKELVKVAILMTDGEFNFATCKGVSSKTWGSGTSIDCDPAKSPFTQAQDICSAMKNQKIVIYTVGLQLTDATAKSFLTACASDKSYAYLAADTDELKTAFKKIATSISKLRIAK